jgi:hypothetical protein
MLTLQTAYCRELDKLPLAVRNTQTAKRPDEALNVP